METQGHERLFWMITLDDVINLIDKKPEKLLWARFKTETKKTRA
ncbi:MAG: hypothetical protein ACLTBV_17530 [Enterocloster bolteae]